MTPAEVHAATLREISIVVEGAAWRQQQATRLSMREAWFTAALSRQSPIMDLAAFLPEEASAPRAAATPEDLWSRIVDWAVSQRGARIEWHEAPVI